MKTIVAADRHVQSKKSYGPDPVLLKKKGIPRPEERDISYYKKKIRDESYLDHAINRIAMELSHFLAK